MGPLTRYMLPLRVLVESEAKTEHMERDGTYDLLSNYNAGADDSFALHHQILRTLRAVRVRRKNLGGNMSFWKTVFAITLGVFFGNVFLAITDLILRVVLRG